MWKTKSDRRSPLKDRPLRLPGRSIQDEMNDLMDGPFLTYIMLSAAFMMVAANDWLATIQTTPRNPWVSTAICAAIVGFCAHKGYRVFRKVQRLKYGRDGERIVAEQLDVLKRQGAVILHDVVGDGFNLDHVILAKKGIFVAETKTWSKPRKGSPTITYDGKALQVEGIKPDRDPIAQAEANARWLVKTLEESTGKKYDVRPVVLFPGWYIKRMPKGCAVWVLEPKALPSFVEHEPFRISDSDLHLAVYHLIRFVRTTPR